MIAYQRSSTLKAVMLSGPLEKRSIATDRASRLIQVALALYLIPALLVVLTVGGVGILVLGIGRLFTGPIQESVS
jgi:hypothetical protein